jgi:hypothetical protein
MSLLIKSPHLEMRLFSIISVNMRRSTGSMGWQSGAVVTSMFEILIKKNLMSKHQRLSPLRSWAGFPVRPNPHVIERATLSNRVGFPRGHRFPPTLHYKSPNIVHRTNNALVVVQLSIQHSKKMGNGMVELW